MKKSPIPKRIDFSPLEEKWQKKWEEIGVYSPDIKSSKKPYYNLMMFPYPSAEGLHVGNMYAFTGVDVHGRFMRMQGYDVFEPIGLDGFGIHSENYALKVGRTPQEHARISEKNFYHQLRMIGNGFDWGKTLETYDPDYYGWTQWLFVQMFKNGLAYRKKASVNWCPSCKTVLADEQVINERCERCSSVIEKKDLEQWFFKITSYAERLLQNTNKPTFNWSEKVKIGQQNWIGKKMGINITYQLAESSLQKLESNKKIQIEVFTTRPDTNFGATFIVVSPEHPQVLDLTIDSQRAEVDKYIKISKSKSKIDRMAEGRKKTGVFTGSYVMNQLNGEKLPVWVADFALMDFGTGAVVGVPGHDKRDFEFAEAMDLPIKRVVVGKDGDVSEITSTEQVQEDEGKMVNSGFLDGMDIQDAIEKMMEHLVEKEWGKRVTTYHLRDWLISRQRYWGAPIPMIYCKKCACEGKSWFTQAQSHSDRSAQWRRAEESDSNNIGTERSLDFARDDDIMSGWYPVPEDQLPVLLPDIKDWKPSGTGKGPLAGVPEFYQTKCPECGGEADRETDVCDTFLDSSWYYLRYPFSTSSHPDQAKRVEGSDELKEDKMRSLDFARDDNKLPWDKEILKKWTPIDSYIGGAEHTVLHLLYTRFVWMALKDWGFIEVDSGQSAVDREENVDSDEPFKRFFAHGLIIKDGAKMSKSKGNVVVPDEYIKLYGADTLRTYLMFLGPFEGGGDFRDAGIAGMYRWLSRVWRLVESSDNEEVNKSQLKLSESQKLFHKTMQTVTQDIQRLHYNTAIAKLMEFVNWWTDHQSEVTREMIVDFLKLLAPFAPHMTEELYQKLAVGSSQLAEKSFESIHTSTWPKFDPSLIREEIIKMIVQVNGKTRDLIDMEVQSAKVQEQVEQIVKSSAKMQKWLTGQKIRQIIFVSGKIINFVI